MTRRSTCSFEPGTLVAERFELRHLAASGGMGAVYRAWDTLACEEVALKLLLWGGTADARRFAQEARLLLELRHPAIVRYVAHGTTAAGALYLAMEWLEGEDLGTRLERGRLSIAETVGVLRRIASALDAAHRQGVIHRDVKPRNIFLERGEIGHGKLLDFGIARAGSAVERLTASGAFVGSLGYIAPEQACGEPELDGRTDLFSLGCVAFRCLVGRAPFSGRDARAVLMKVVLADVPSLRTLRAEVPEALEVLVGRLLAKSPDGRPPAASEVLGALSQLALPGEESPSACAHMPVLTSHERWLRCLVVAGTGIQGLSQGPSGGLSDGRSRGPSDRPSGGLSDGSSGSLSDGLPATVPDNPSQTLPRRSPSPQARALASLIDRHGGSLRQLADGTSMIAMRRHGAATDQAARAARCALGLRLLDAQVPIVLVAEREDELADLGNDEVLERAAALLAGTAPSAIALDAVMAGLLDGRFEVVAEAGVFLLRGEGEPSQTTRTVLGRRSQFVGRERELELLRGLFAECASEPVARAALVAAPPGMGKSRLLGELTASLMRDGEAAPLLLAQGDPLRAGSPFDLVAAAIRRAAGLTGREPAAVQENLLAERVGRHLAQDQRREVAEVIGELAGIPFADPSPRLRAARDDRQQMGESFTRALVTWIAAECSQRPTLIVLDDLHWGDRPSVTLVEMALRQLGHLPLMVLALARPEVHDLFPDLFAGQALLEIGLTPLRAKPAERLVQAMLGETAPREASERIVEQAAGNPFYLEELIRAWCEGQRDAFPTTLLAMAEARMQTLSADERRLLRAASVLGETFWLDALALLTADPQLGRHLEELLERDFLIAGRVANQYRFRHSLLRDAAYAMLTDEDRRIGHRLAAAWLARAEQPDPLALAQHHQLGGEPERAAEWYLRVAERALSGSDFATARLRARDGISCRAAGGLLGALWLVLAEAEAWVGGMREATEHARKAMSFLPQTSVRWCRAAAVYFMAFSLSGGEVGGGAGGGQGIGKSIGEDVGKSIGEDVGKSGGAGANAAWVVRCLLEAEPEPGALHAYAEALNNVAATLSLRGPLPPFEELLCRLQSVVAAASPADAVAEGWLDMVLGYRSLYYQDNAWAARQFAEAAIGKFESGFFERGALVARTDRALASAILGGYAEAIAELREVIRQSERFGGSYLTFDATTFLALALVMAGELGEARATALAGLEKLPPDAIVPIEGSYRMVLGIASAGEGDAAGAERELGLAAQSLAPVPLLRSMVLAALAEIQLWSGRPAEARGNVDSAIELLQSIGLGGGASSAYPQLVLAQVLDAAGDHQAGCATIASGREAVLRAAERIPDPTWRERFLSNVQENRRVLELAEVWLMPR